MRFRLELVSRRPGSLVPRTQEAQSCVEHRWHAAHRALEEAVAERCTDTGASIGANSHEPDGIRRAIETSFARPPPTHCKSRWRQKWAARTFSVRQLRVAETEARPATRRRRFQHLGSLGKAWAPQASKAEARCVLEIVPKRLSIRRRGMIETRLYIISIASRPHAVRRLGLATSPRGRS